jgi:hypothetical protein
VAILEFDVAGYLMADGFASQLGLAHDVGDRVDSARLRLYLQRAALAEPVARGAVAFEQRRRTSPVPVNQ